MKRSFALCSVALATLACSARAAVLYTSFGGSDLGAYSTAGTFMGSMFTPTSSGTLSLLTFEAFANPTGAGTWSMGLYNNASGQPGTLIEGWTALVPDSSSVTTTTLTSVVHPLLSLGTAYWFVVHNTTGATNLAWESFRQRPSGVSGWGPLSRR